MNAAIQACQDQLSKIEARLAKLKELMSKKHISADDAKAMGELAVALNRCEGNAKEWLRIYEEASDLRRRWNTQALAAHRQIQSHAEWANEELSLLTAKAELDDAIRFLQSRYDAMSRTTRQTTVNVESAGDKPHAAEYGDTKNHPTKGANA